jgi:ATP-dependent Zn protease
MLAEALLKYETLDAEDVKAILNSTKNNGNSSSDT